jgi:hypothetical protein
MNVFASITSSLIYSRRTQQPSPGGNSFKYDVQLIDIDYEIQTHDAIHFYV